ncbi:TIGR02281 family clan AA aspartic protease [Trichocoleus sp. FACHB-46]|uniref:Retroviral-like aspartic protease family protein n=1 Tax=Trichocoleus desertorum GB2-A4 TaxID=2933944 RepID=A0ABV0J518_9CYAN|nr:retropepsin-like aspartic protease [Trichocoleus sp. FACHB-46]MBD1863707.1 retroviral-like aspartic protease family protein [Trichocoleus sp. FACHB-46]
MLRFFCLTAVLAAALSPLLPRFSTAAIAQELDGCYMLNPAGRSIDLSKLCGTTPGNTHSPNGTLATFTRTNTLLEGQVFQAKILRREAGTPIIGVTFNGNQTFEMIVDTGASGTVVTQRMAAMLRLVPVAKLKFDTASAKGIELPLGKIHMMEVNGAKAQGLLVAIAGPQLETGLLGHDFFGKYDITIKRDVVEFRVR